jgi:hypothetical protein
VARRAFKLFTRLRGAAGDTQDPGGHDCEPELEAVSITRFPEVILLFLNSQPRLHPSSEVPGSSAPIIGTHRCSEYYEI